VSTVSGAFTQNKNGLICTFTVTGGYIVSPDGTATITVTGTTTNPACKQAASVEASVLFEMGKGVAFVDTTAGVVLGSLLKQ